MKETRLMNLVLILVGEPFFPSVGAEEGACSGFPSKTGTKITDFYSGSVGFCENIAVDFRL